jgi:hypothetical protein
MSYHFSRMEKRGLIRRENGDTTVLPNDQVDGRDLTPLPMIVRIAHAPNCVADSSDQIFARHC